MRKSPLVLIAIGGFALACTGPKDVISESGFDSGWEADADADADADSDTDSDADSDSDTDSDTDVDADTDADSDADSDTDADTDADGDTDDDTGIVYYGWQGDYTITQDTADEDNLLLDGTFGMWFYYAKTGSYICEWDAPNPGVGMLSDCDDCAVAWETEWGNGSTTSGSCTDWGLVDGDDGGETFGVADWFGVGFAPKWESGGTVYSDVAMMQFDEGGDWYGVAYANYDGLTLDFTMYSSYTAYY